MVVADIVFPHGFEKLVGANDIRLHEWSRICDRVVVVGFGREVHDCIMPRNHLIQHSSIAYIADDEINLASVQACQILWIACIGQLVQNSDMGLGMLFCHHADKIRSDESTSSCHQDVLRSMLDRLRCIMGSFPGNP